MQGVDSRVSETGADWIPSSKERAMSGSMQKQQMPAPHEAPSGRVEKMRVPEKHFVNGNPLAAPSPSGLETALVGLGCFWGAEKGFWQLPGVYSTAVGYAGGFTPNPPHEGGGR